MDLRATILGFLSWKPLSGYDLKKILSESDIFYWSGNNNQVYKNLLELQKDGLVTYQVQPQESLPAKKIYSITEKGLAELQNSLQATPDLPELHKNFLIQLAWCDLLSDEQLIELLERYESEVEQRLKLYQGQAETTGAWPKRSKREVNLWRRIHQNLLDTFQTELAWTRQTMLDLREKNYLKDNEAKP